MNRELNFRISRSGLQVKSSPTGNMGNGKDRQASPKAGTHTGTGTGSSTGTGTTSKDGDIVICSMQDVWGFVTSMQATMMKQSEDIKNLALKNQALEHRIQMQDMKILQQEEQLQVLKDAFNSQTLTTQDTLATHGEKLTQICDKSQSVSGHAGSWANIVRNGQAILTPTDMNDDMYGNVVDTECIEQEKRKMNIVIRGVPETDTEQVLTLNTDITDIISNKFGMHDVVIYGAHRVGKKKPESHRAIVCTLLDARKRAIILENARIYLKDSPLYISEDRTPSQQKARREAYEARTNKKVPPIDTQDNNK